jgi:hypothetical protein
MRNAHRGSARIAKKLGNGESYRKNGPTGSTRVAKKVETGDSYRKNGLTLRALTSEVKLF